MPVALLPLLLLHLKGLLSLTAYNFRLTGFGREEYKSPRIVENINKRKERQMPGRLNVTLYGLIILVLAFFPGCAPPATTKPDVSGAPAQTAAKERSTKAPAKAKAPASSLEAAREGKAPAAGPLAEIYFDFDRYELRADARTTLKKNADWLKANPSARVEVEGHADERGTNEYNLALGAKRAQAASDYLSTLGVAKGRLSTKSYGEELPVCKEKNEGCWQRNRRDRFVVTPARAN
jgi:peptidoglycan-associated lipoprotein